MLTVNQSVSIFLFPFAVTFYSDLIVFITAIILQKCFELFIFTLPLNLKSVTAFDAISIPTERETINLVSLLRFSETLCHWPVME